MLKNFNHSKLNQIINNVTLRKYIFGAVFNISAGDKSQSWCGASGNIKADSRYYIASINKLFISAIALKLISQGRMSFEDTLSKYLPKNLIADLHVYRGKDYSNDITIFHMLSQTSGLPCYILDKPQNGISVLKQLEAGIDCSWPTEKVVEYIKILKPHFPPGEGRKAVYTDTNHQLLSLVIKKITGTSIKGTLNHLFSELNMKNTHVYDDYNDRNYIFPYYKDKQMDINQFMTSTNNDIISTARDQMIFIRAFFNGYFYPKEKLKMLEKWKPIFFPFQYGVGIQKFYMPRYLTPFKAVPDMVGHCGSTGSVAFYIPDADLYITGTTNQQASPNVAFQTLIKIVHVLN